MSNTKWWIEGTLARVKEVISALLVILGVAWFIGKPMVDSYIEKAIAGQGYASQGSVENLNAKAFKNSRKLEEVRDLQIKQEQQLKNIEGYSKEMRQLMYQLLRQQPAN